MTASGQTHPTSVGGPIRTVTESCRAGHEGSDITCIATVEGRLYLAAVINLFCRQVVGWSMQPHMQTSLVTDTLRMAWFRRHPEPGLIFHSDRGSPCCSGDFQAALKGDGMRSSMSCKWRRRRPHEVRSQLARGPDQQGSVTDWPWRTSDNGQGHPIAQGELTCVTTLVNRGKTIANLESRIHLGGVLVAQTKGNDAIFTPRQRAA